MVRAVHGPRAAGRRLHVSACLSDERRRVPAPVRLPVAERPASLAASLEDSPFADAAHDSAAVRWVSSSNGAWGLVWRDDVCGTEVALAHALVAVSGDREGWDPRAASRLRTDAVSGALFSSGAAVAEAEQSHTHARQLRAFLFRLRPAAWARVCRTDRRAAGVDRSFGQWLQAGGDHAVDPGGQPAWDRMADDLSKPFVCRHARPLPVARQA